MGPPTCEGWGREVAKTFEHFVVYKSPTYRYLNAEINKCTISKKKDKQRLSTPKFRIYMGNKQGAKKQKVDHA